MIIRLTNYTTVSSLEWPYMHLIKKLCAQETYRPKKPRLRSLGNVALQVQLHEVPPAPPQEVFD